MTLSEFKAWFDGFCDGIKGAPTEDQFARMREKIADLREHPALPYLPPAHPAPNYTPSPVFITPSTPNTGSPPFYRVPDVWCGVSGIVCDVDPSLRLL